MKKGANSEKALNKNALSEALISIVKALKLQQLLDKSMKVALAQYKFDAEEVLLHRRHLMISPSTAKLERSFSLMNRIS